MNKNPFHHMVCILLFCVLVPSAPTAVLAEEEVYESESCTSIMVGKLASVDGSTTTSHSCDSNSDRSWMTIVPNRKHKTGSLCPIFVDAKNTRGPLDSEVKAAGSIPQVAETYAYLNTAYPIMNEYQLAIGETTIGGRKELHSVDGLLDAPELFRLCLERAKSAREAIRLIDELTRIHGYNDWGESFTFADKKEVWLLEIYGPGEGRKGALWVAQRVPDDHVSVSANASRIRQIDLKKPDWFMASENIYSLALEKGWWKEADGPFEFCYAYAPSSRTSLGCRRREWRVLSLLAPSLDLNPHSENYPFSLKPDKKVSIPDILAIFRDSYADTDFDMTRSLTMVNKENQTVKNPVATPFMNSETRALLKLPRERLICSLTCTYLQITQSRDWLPDPIGGIVWIGYDNPAATPHIPIYIGSKQTPPSFMVDGRREYSRACAWWAFRTVAKLAQFRWQEMSLDIQKVWLDIENQAFSNQEAFEKEVLALWKHSPKKARDRLTEYTVKTAEDAVAAYWKLADELWVNYSRHF